MAIDPDLHGRRGHAHTTVSAADTAEALGSGDVPVLATPRLVALAEAATVAALLGALPPGQTSVGTEVHLEHVRASPIGAGVRVEAVLVAVEGRRLRFEVTATDEPGGDVVGRGWVVRAVVDRERLLRGR